MGPVGVVDPDGSPLPIGGPRRQAVLAALLLRRGTGLPVERLVDMLWVAAPPASAATMVHAAVSGLRKVLEPDHRAGGFRVLTTQAGGYRLDVVPEQLDAVRFEQLLAAGRQLMDESPRFASSLLAEALALWHGPALVGVEEPFARAAAARLDELRLQCVELYADVELRLGHQQALVAEVEELVGAHPLRESLCARLMVALYRCGRRADALAAYHAVRRTLVAELGVEPGPELRRLHLSILRDGEELRAEEAAQTVRARAGARLPVPVGSFVGRRREQDDVLSMLRSHRLVTLTGTGGVGKTRLALRVAERDDAEAVMVDLASVSSPGLVEQALADALRIRPEPGQPLLRTITAALSAQPTLVVLDGCEHLLGACADVVQSMLAASAEVQVLATSRECLALPGERVYPVGPLGTPQPDESGEGVAACEAVALFADRAAAARPGFTVTGQNASLVGELCRRLDGLPLAIELAAARIAALPLGELVARLGDRFTLLESVTRAADRRHRGLAATLDWSYDLLDAAGRALFARLAVFPAAFDLPAVKAVCAGDELPADVLGLVLARLVACSLLQLDDEPVGDARYRLLETVREYARQRLDPTARAALEQRHAAHFLAFARQARPRLFGAGSGPWLRKLHIERDNLRAALEWGFGAGGDRGTAIALVGCLWHYWDVFGAREEGLRWVHTALTVVDTEHADRRMPLLSAAALLHLGRAEFAATARQATEQLALSRAEGDRGWEGDALAMLATIDWAMGRFDRARQRYEDAIAASLAGGDRWRAAMAEAQLARLHRDRYEPDAARQVALRSRAHAEEVGEGLARGLALDVLASLEHRWGDDHTARKLVANALEQYRQVHYQEGEASALALTGAIALRRGDTAAAGEAYDQSLRLCRRIGHRAGAATATEGLAAVASAAEDPDRADDLNRAAASLRAQIGVPRPAGD